MSDKAFGASLEAYLEAYSFDETFMEIVNKEVHFRTKVILSAVAAAVDNETWNKIQDAVEKAYAQEF